MPDMFLGDLLKDELVVDGLRATSKKNLLQQLVDIACSHCECDASAAFEVLITREKLGSTGIGGGVAIPHGRVPGLKSAMPLFVRLAEPVEFEARDGKKIDLLFMLLMPEPALAYHLSYLSRASKLLHNQDICRSLRAAKNRTELFKAITGVGKQNFAA